MSIFKKKGGQVNAANVHMTEAEAALAQSDFNIEKITEIQNKFAGGAVLLVPGRIFIREGLLYKVCRKGLKKRQFFLFNDILVYGSIVAGLYSNQLILPLSQMSVSADCFYQPRVDADFISETDEEKLDVANAFQISHANKSFHVFGQSAADKANWIANLQKHISRVAKTLSDSRTQVLTRPVWVPDSMSKECMICTTRFTPFLRKHHCRRCGRVVCSSCSPHRVSLVTGEGGVATVASEGQGKLERTCRECFKEMTAVHNRANSLGSSSNKYDVTKATPTRPPPPAVAAQLVSAAIRNVTTPPAGEGESPEREHVDISTDTEDSDDSGNEQDTEPRSAPIPAKRNSTNKVEVSRPVPASRHNIKTDSSPPVPLARRSLKTSSDESSPTLSQKASNQNAVSDDDEPQPTPPPRKKKLLKQKLKEQQESAKTEEERQDKDLPEAEGTDGHTPQTESPSNKKTRRRNKFKPHEEPKASESELVASVQGDTCESEARDGAEVEDDNVKSEGVEGVAGDGDGVEGVGRDGVECEGDGDGDRVEAGDRDGMDGVEEEAVNSEVRDSLQSENTNRDVPDVPESDKSTKTDTQTETETNETVKEAGDDSPNVEAAVKRGGRRRQKFKPSTPQD